MFAAVNAGIIRNLGDARLFTGRKSPKIFLIVFESTASGCTPRI